jgi:hypothetical protein
MNTKQIGRIPANKRRLLAAFGVGAGLLVISAAAGSTYDKPVFKGIDDHIRYRESFENPFLEDTYNEGFWGRLARHTHHPVAHGPVAPPIVFKPGMTIREWDAWKGAGQYPPGMATDTLDHSPNEEYAGPPQQAQPYGGAAPWTLP